MNALTVSVRELPLVQPLERRRLQCYLGLILADCGALLAGFVAAGFLYLGSSGAGRAAIIAQLVMPLYLTIALYNGAYSMDALTHPRRGTRWRWRPSRCRPRWSLRSPTMPSRARPFRAWSSPVGAC